MKYKKNIIIALLTEHGHRALRLSESTQNTYNTKTYINIQNKNKKRERERGGEERKNERKKNHRNKQIKENGDHTDLSFVL